MAMDEMRFSDKELIELRKDFDTHKNLQDLRWTQMTNLMRENTHMTRQALSQLAVLSKSTEGVVKLYGDFQGSVRLGGGLARFIFFLGKCGIVGAGAIKLIEWALHLIKG